MTKYDPKNNPQRSSAGNEAELRRQQRKRPADLPWHPAWRFLVSVLVVLHVTAVFCAPWDLSTSAALPPGYNPPRDNLGRELPPPQSTWQEPVIPRALRQRFFRHYLNLMYLNHGYEFFAPDPNGSNLIRYHIFDSGGKETVTGTFPDLKSQWPRLYYHRHMMLAAQTGNMGEESGRHYAQHLLKAYGGQAARLEWLLHTLLSPQQVRDGVPLDAPQTFVQLAEIQETAGNRVGPPTGETPIAIPGGGN